MTAGQPAFSERGRHGQPRNHLNDMNRISKISYFQVSRTILIKRQRPSNGQFQLYKPYRKKLNRVNHLKNNHIRTLYTNSNVGYE